MAREVDDLLQTARDLRLRLAAPGTVAGGEPAKAALPGAP
jgi:hypothetical protein